MHEFEVEKGRRVRVVPTVEFYAGQEGYITASSIVRGEWWVEVRLDSNQVVDFRLWELFAI